MPAEPVPLPPAERTADRATRAWAAAQLALLLDGHDPATVPDYGSPAWIALPAADNRRAAALILAAEAWRAWCQIPQPDDVGLELSPEVVDAFVAHLEDHLHREWTTAMDAADAAQWAPVRQRLAELRATPTWAEQQELRRLPPPVTVRATDGWPPVAIPGRPGQHTAQEAA